VGNSRDKKIVIIKLIQKRKKIQPTTKSSVCLVKVSGVIPLASNPGVVIQVGALIWSHHVTGL
jgi:hypothetical protein